MGAEPMQGLAQGVDEVVRQPRSQGGNEATPSPRLATPPREVTRECPLCLSTLAETAQKCRHCGEWVARPCRRCGTSLRGEWAARGVCVECEGKKDRALVKHTTGLVAAPPKNKSVAALTSFFLGGFGSHRFYLGDPFTGLFYLIFCWTLIPSVIGMVEGVRLAVMDDEEFHRRYSGAPLE